MSNTLAKISAIALGRPFLDSLARGLMAKLKKSKPINLGNTVIILPSEDARYNLLKILTSMAGSKALILPRTYTLSESFPYKRPRQKGNLDWLLPLDLLPDELPVPSISRDLLLGRLIFQWQKGYNQTNSQSLNQCIKIAPTLGALLDELQAFNINYLSLDPSTISDDSAYWASVDNFLKIIIKQWPRILSEQSWKDPILYDQLTTELLIQHWKREPPKDNIIAAGFAGNLPHVTNLLSFITSLPTGHVVVPSLDRRLDIDSWENLPKDHPQSSIKKLLDILKVGDSPLPEWPGGFDQPNLIPPHKPSLNFVTSIFSKEDAPDKAEASQQNFSDLTLITSQTIYHESQTIALIIKEFLTNHQGSVSLIAEDQKLIKQVALQLRKWNLDLCHPVGQTADSSTTGPFFQLVAEMMCSAVAPVSLLSALKHPMCHGHASPNLFRYLRRELELNCLRGIRPASGFAGIIASLKMGACKNKRVIAWLQELDKASCDFDRLVKNKNVPLKNLLAAHLDFSIWLRQTGANSNLSPWESDADKSLYHHLRALCSRLKESFTLNGAEYSDIFSILLHTIPNEVQILSSSRIYVYSPEQALFSSSSLHILAGMNETTWPPIFNSDQWLSSQMRSALGLQSNEQAKGFASLQFCQAAGASKVVFTRRKMMNGTQTTPSYHFAQVENATKKAGLHHTIDQSRCWNDLGQQLEQEAIDIPKIRRPAPTPPISARPRSLSATQIERWMRDPYGIFVSTILKIKPLRPVDAKVSSSDYGRMVHEALQRFIRNYPRDMPQNALQRLLELGQDSFRRVRVQPDAYAFWWSRFERLARYFIDQERKSQRHTNIAYAEVSGTTTINLASGPFTLTTRADRINIRTNGKVDIIDYKTGVLPTTPQIMNGSKPQLLLEALIALDNGFKEIDTGIINSIISIQISGASVAGYRRSIEHDIPTKAEELLSRVSDLIESFDDERTPYYFVPHNDFTPQHNEFEHLARMKEWLALPQKHGSDK